MAPHIEYTPPDANPALAPTNRIERVASNGSAQFRSALYKTVGKWMLGVVGATAVGSIGWAHTRINDDAQVSAVHESRIKAIEDEMATERKENRVALQHIHDEDNAAFVHLEDQLGHLQDSINALYQRHQ